MQLNELNELHELNELYELHELNGLCSFIAILSHNSKLHGRLKSYLYHSVANHILITNKDETLSISNDL